MQAFVLYLFAFFTSASGGLLSQSTIQNAGVPGANDGQYLIGVGIGDVTGPVVETNMMARAMLPDPTLWLIVNIIGICLTGSDRHGPAYAPAFSCVHHR
jgi:hypothetical protein